MKIGTCIESLVKCFLSRIPTPCIRAQSLAFSITVTNNLCSKGKGIQGGRRAWDMLVILLTVIYTTNFWYASRIIEIMIENAWTKPIIHRLWFFFVNHKHFWFLSCQTLLVSLSASCRLCQNQNSCNFYVAL